jgi:hypothetical protein
MGIYEIKSFRGALSDWEDKGIPGAFKFGTNLDIRKQIDSLSCDQDYIDEGILSSSSPSLSVSPSASVSATPSSSRSASSSATPSPSSSVSPSPSPTPSASVSPSSSKSPSPSASGGLTTVFEGLIRTFVKGSDGYIYGFDNTGCIYRRDGSAFWQRVYKSADGEIKGAEEKPSDSGKTYLYFATDTKLFRKELPGLSNWNDVETVAQNLRSVDWHTMKQVAGSLMICNGEYLGMVGYDDSYTNEALDLIPGNIVKTLVERNGRVIIGTVKKNDPSRGVNGAIDAEVPLAQVGDGELHFANMSDTMPIKKFPGNGKVNPSGFCNEVEQVNFFEWDQDSLSWIDKQSVGNLALFAVYNAESGKGGIYSYGRKNKNHPMVMNLDYQFDADELGAITNIEGTTLVSYRDGTDFGVKATNPNLKATATYEGLDFRAPVKNPANITTWKYAEVYCDPLVKWTSILFWYRVDKNGLFLQAKMENGSGSFDAPGEKKGVFLIQAEGEIFEPKVTLIPTVNTSPQVHRIRIYFD